MSLKRTQYRLILKKDSNTEVSNYPDIMETIYIKPNMFKVVYLTTKEYTTQLHNANDLWRHPITNEHCWFDDQWFEEYE